MNALIEKWKANYNRPEVRTGMRGTTVMFMYICYFQTVLYAVVAFLPMASADPEDIKQAVALTLVMFAGSLLFYGLGSFFAWKADARNAGQEVYVAAMRTACAFGGMCVAMAFLPLLNGAIWQTLISVPVVASFWYGLRRVLQSKASRANPA